MKKKSRIKTKIIQVDQSGKIEQTEKPTVLAAADGESKVIIISAKEKRRLQEWFRLIGAPTLFIDTVFSVMLYLLIKDLVKLTTKFIVDIEYPGHTKIIRDMVSRLISDVIIEWKSVGKTSSAHEIAYQAYHKKIKAKKFTAEEIWQLSQKASVELAKLKAGGRLNTGLLPANRRSAPANTKRLPQKRKKVKKSIIINQ